MKQDIAALSVTETATLQQCVFLLESLPKNKVSLTSGMVTNNVPGPFPSAEEFTAIYNRKMIKETGMRLEDSVRWGWGQ